MQVFLWNTALLRNTITLRAGKTTVVRKFNGESIDEICPTLGFNIKTMDFQARRALLVPLLSVVDGAAGLQAESLGCGGAEESAHVLAELLRAN
jgi:hypothetical protein